MILPIISYGHDILIKKCQKVSFRSEKIQELVDNMWMTLYAAHGVGLAAPQVNESLQVFVVDSIQTFQIMNENERKKFFISDQGVQMTFINAIILEYSRETWVDRESCLSLPGFSVEIERPWSILVQYQDAHFHEHETTFEGMTARMIQHEFDHTQGILFLDYLTSFKKALLSDKLKKIEEGKVHTNYPMKFPL